MAITVKHKYVSAIPDAGDSTIVQPSNWNDDHQLTGTVPVANGGTGASDAPTALTNLGAYPASNPSGYGTGTVTSVAATVPSFLSVTGSPITTSGTLALTYSGTALPVANGGTGVTSSSGANSVVLRDANGNITTNCLFEGFSSQAASGTTITLTASSAQNLLITGSGGQTIKLPNATTLPNGALFTFNNNQSSGAITVVNNSSTTIATINAGGYVTVVLLDNSIAAGSWDRHDSTPANVSWSTNTLDYAGSITSATWNGTAVAINRGGTGQTTASTAFNALSPLTTAGDTLYGGTSGAGTRLAIGTAGQVLTVNSGATAPQWSTPTTGTVTSVGQSFTGGLISVTGSPVTSSGTLALTVAGTSGGVPYFSSASTWASSAALTQYGVVYGGGAGGSPVATAAGTTGQVLTANTGGAPTWSSAGSGTVTSVAATVPAFLSISGSPITSSGTLAIGLSGTALPVANGGTGVTSAGAITSTINGYTTTATAGGTTTLTNASTVYQVFTGTLAQTIVMPVTSTLATGWRFEIVNNSTQAITVQSSGANTIATLQPSISAILTCIGTALTTAADWKFAYSNNGTVTGMASNALAVFSAGPTFSGTVTTNGLTANGALQLGGLSTNNATFHTNATTSATTIGGTGQTGILTLGRSTATQQTDIQAGATTTGNTKTINLGTAGAAGSTTTIIIGSTTGTSTTTVNGILKLQTYTVATLPSASTSGVGAKSFVTDALAPAFGATVASGGAVAVPVYSDGTNWKVG